MGTYQTLLIATDPELRKQYIRVLRQKSCQVIATHSRAEALRALRNLAFDTLVLCYSLSSASCEEYAELFRQRNPNGRVVAVLREEAIDEKLKADTYVVGNDLEELVKTVTPNQRRRKRRARAPRPGSGTRHSVS